MGDGYQAITEYAEQGTAMKVTFVHPSEPGKRPVIFEMASFYDGGEHDICISTLAGCSRICTFCSVPAYRGFDAYLTPQDIVFQVNYALRMRNPDHRLRNVVGMMGNGEPFGNMKISTEGQPFLFETLKGLTHLPIDRLTISTVGDRPDVLRKFLDRAQTFHSPFPIMLQLSLHTPFDEERKQLIPTAKPLAQTIRFLDASTALSGQAVKYNIVLLSAKNGGYTNATPAHASAVARLLQSPSLWNGMAIPRIPKLSVYNPFPGSAFVPVSEAAAQHYVTILRQEGVTVIKTFQGSGIAIDTAQATGGFSCGQLAVTTKEKLRVGC